MQTGLTAADLVINTLVFKDLIDQGMQQSELLGKLHNLGIKKVEIRREYIEDCREIENIRKTAETLGMEIWYSVPQLLFSGSLCEETTLHSYFCEAEALGAVQMKMTGGYTEEVKQKEIELLKKMIKNTQLNRFTIENDQVSAYSKGDKMHRLINSLRDRGVDISFTFDIGNFLYVEEDPVANAELLSETVSVIHLKDVKKEPLSTVCLGEGDIPFSKVFHYLPDDADIVVEYPCGKQPWERLQKEMKKITEQE